MSSKTERGRSKDRSDSSSSGRQKSRSRSRGKSGGGSSSDDTPTDICDCMSRPYVQNKDYLRSFCYIVTEKWMMAPFLLTVAASCVFEVALYRLEYSTWLNIDRRITAIPRMLMWLMLVAGYCVDVVNHLMFALPAILIAAGGLVSTYLYVDYAEKGTSTTLIREATGWSDEAGFVFLLLWWAAWSMPETGPSRFAIESFDLETDGSGKALNGSEEVKGSPRRCTLFNRKWPMMWVFLAALLTERGFWLVYFKLRGVYSSWEDMSPWLISIPSFVKWGTLFASFAADFIIAWMKTKSWKLRILPLLSLMFATGGALTRALWAWYALSDGRVNVSTTDADTGITTVSKLTTRVEANTWVEEMSFYAIAMIYAITWLVQPVRGSKTTTSAKLSSVATDST